MVRGAIVFLTTCIGIVIIQTIVPIVVAMRDTPNVDEFMIEDRRTHRRQNYIVRDLDDEIESRLNSIEGIGNIGPEYNTGEALESESNPEELPEMIVDYANMIRNDILLLDNSMQTRTRKRGNIKKSNQALPEFPCSCKSFKKTIDLGSDYYPQYLENRNCSEGRCEPPYACKDSYYYITVLKRKQYRDKKSSTDDLPKELSKGWVTNKVKITTGCVCARDTDK